MSKFSLKDFFGSAIDSVVSSVGDAIDKNVTNKEEKLAAEKAITEVLLNYQGELDSEVTERLRIDMTSDSWLSKNVRPLTLIATFTIMVVTTLFDGNVGEFSVNVSYLPIWQSAFITVLMFYFGSRGIEKIVKDYNTGKTNNK